MHFIKTTDNATKELLANHGFQLMSDKGGVATFLNDTSKPLTFADKTKISYSNVLTM